MRQAIQKSLMKKTFQTPEDIRNRVADKTGKFYYVDTVSRDLRKMRALGLVESHPFDNRSGKGKHLRWKLVEK